MKRTFRLSEARPDARRDVSDEIRFHLDMRTQEYVERGMSAEDARRAALASFGDVAAIEAECRGERERRTRDRARRDWMRGTVIDVTYAVRTLRKNLGFTVAALLTLALGIGATGAVFTVVNGVLIRPLPYRDPARLAMVWTVGQGARGTENQWPLSAANYLDIKAWNKSLESLAAFRFWPYVLGDAGGEAEQIAGSRARPELFATLGVRPLLGRTYTAEEATPGGPKVAVIGYDLWQRRFAGARDVIGRQASFSGERFTIVGVMPPGFAFPRGAELPSGLQFRPRTEVWTPLVFDQNDLRQRGTLNLAAVGRIKPGIAAAVVQADLAGIARRLGEAFPGLRGLGLHSVTVKEQAAAPVRRGLLILMGAVAFVLLIACANVANLLVARTASRDRELAVRTALGATSGRVARQLVTENVLLALGGAALGVLVALWGSRALLALVPGTLPRADDVAVDARVIVVTLVIAVAAGVVFGLATAFHSARANPAAGLQGIRSTSGLGRRAARRVLVVAEVALSIVLLVGAGLLTESFLRLQSVSPGFRPDGAMTAGLLLPIIDFNPARDGPRWAATLGAYAERLNAIPGVEAAGGVSTLPLTGAYESSSFTIVGRPRPPQGQSPSADYSVVTPGYFRAMGTPMVAGRTFDSRDRLDAPRAIIVNREAARRYWPGESALGKRITLFDSTSIEIVGIVGDARQLSLDAPPTPAMYLPESQYPYPFLTFVLRTRPGGDPASVLPLMRRELKAMDPSLALNDVRTLRSVVDESLARQRFSMIVIGVFAGAALVLAVVGLYGVIAYSVAQRTRELGVRMALGAQPRDVLRLVLAEGMRVTGVGVLVGLAGALAVTRVMRTLLYDVSATNAATYGSVALLIAAVALAASYVPARRATRVDPTMALRGE